VRKHVAIIVLLAAGTALRVMAQLAYRPALIYIDTPKYLITSDGTEPEGYRVFVRPLERMGGLGLVTVTQHLMGLAMGVALYTLLVRRGAPRWAAALAAAPVLLDSYQLVLEENVMPDVIFETLLTAGIVLLAWRARPPWWLIAAGALTMGAAADVREIGLVLMAPLVLFAAVIARDWRLIPWHVALAATAFGIPVLGYMSMAYGMGGHFALVSSPQPLTYGRAAYAADCATLKVPRLERGLCPSPVVVRSLNQGIDSLLHSPRWSPLAHLNQRAQQEKATLTRNFAWEVIRQQPLRVATSVARDAVRLFAVTRDGSSRITDITRFQFQTSYPLYPPATTARLDKRMAHGSPVVAKPLARWLRGYQLDGGYTPGPMLAACLIAAELALIAAALASQPWGRRRRWRADPELTAACLLATLSGGGTLLASDFYEFSWRYQLPAFVTLPLAGALGVLVLTRLTRRHRHDIQIADQRDLAVELLGGLGWHPGLGPVFITLGEVRQHQGPRTGLGGDPARLARGQVTILPGERLLG
jgi:hypothetical protein